METEQPLNAVATSQPETAVGVCGFAQDWLYGTTQSQTALCYQPRATAQLDTVDAHSLFVLPREGHKKLLKCRRVTFPPLSPSLWQYTSLSAARSNKSSATITRDKSNRWCTWPCRVCDRWATCTWPMHVTNSTSNMHAVLTVRTQWVYAVSWHGCPTIDWIRSSINTVSCCRLRRVYDSPPSMYRVCWLTWETWTPTVSSLWPTCGHCKSHGWTRRDKPCA
jgi:hypothetical protein